MQLDRVGETKEKTRCYRALWLCSVAVTLAPPITQSCSNTKTNFDLNLDRIPLLELNF
jgi:hypothetical protein